MKRPKKLRQQMLASCAEIGPDDGTDPRDLAKSNGRRRLNRKTLQLCGQIADALNVAFSGCGDSVLSGLLLVDVKPAPNPGRLLVTVAASPSAGVWDAGDVLAHLDRAAGLLRSEVAVAIHRRRTPELAFCVAVRP